jgi:DeoR/GlpR family transcriptional regulator of sugar metabolism
LFVLDKIPLARRDLIARRLAKGQSVVAATLAAEFNVSEDAIRRDLRSLADDGQCRRVYGGALPVSPHATPIAARIEEGRERKEALARKASDLIQPGELIFLDNSSTNLAVTGFLPRDCGLSVATNSIDIAAALHRRQDLQLIMIGGAVNAFVGGCVDADAVLSITKMNIDRCFLGACSVSATSGVSAFVLADATFKRALLASSRQSLVLATTEKFDVSAPYRVAAIGKIDCLVVEHDAPADKLEALTQTGASILKADRPI